MEFTEEQIKNIKQQIINQINSTFPEDKKFSAIQQIEEMNSEQLIEFLKKNNLIKNPREETGKNQQCIFCAIVNKQIESYEIENFKDAIAVLEINPISYGHILIIPKQHSKEKEKIEKETKRLVNKIKKKINLRLNPKDIITEYSELFGHGVINLIPIYKNESIISERKKLTKKEIEELQNKLKRKIRIQRTKVKKKLFKKKIIKEEINKKIKSKEKKIKIIPWSSKRIP